MNQLEANNRHPTQVVVILLSIFACAKMLNAVCGECEPRFLLEREVYFPQSVRAKLDACQ